MTNPLKTDLDHILLHTEKLWEEIREKRIFITGGTGFFGSWLLESFAWANDKLNLNASATVLSRNPLAFEKKASHLFRHPAITFIQGDINNFKFPDARFSHLIHAGVYQQLEGEKKSPLLMVNEMLNSTKRVLDFCTRAKVKKLLLISTGAVYGPIPSGLTKIPEDFSGSFDPSMSSSAYHNVRRMMENLGVLYAEEHNFEVKIARCFSFIGPYLPLNGRFAVGDFIMNALSERPILIKGNGKPIRSYLYSADLAYWLWTILFKGRPCRPYNVGSESPITIKRIAEEIAGASEPPLKVSILDKYMTVGVQDRYVPDTTRARTDIGLRQIIPLAECIEKTIRWYRGFYSGKKI